ncbi:hypothetical protein ARTHRO9AX_20174 [Arthrobacter sp. 9AX]|nr:hypothetical protein ARTHRO9AX_20174 [Arthrobacter sp. 9AX]
MEIPLKQDVNAPFTEVKLVGDIVLENYQVTGIPQLSAECCIPAGTLAVPAPGESDDLNRSSHRPRGRCRSDVPWLRAHPPPETRPLRFLRRRLFLRFHPHHHLPVVRLRLLVRGSRLLLDLAGCPSGPAACCTELR